MVHFFINFRKLKLDKSIWCVYLVMIVYICLFVSFFLSQEIVRRTPSHMWLSTSRRRIKDQEVVLHLFVDLHDACFITASIAVVRCWEDSHDLLFMTPVVTLKLKKLSSLQKRQYGMFKNTMKFLRFDTYSHDELMCSSNCLKTILLDELVRNILSESVASTSWRNTPACSIIWIRPKEVTHGTFMRHFNHSVDISNHVKGI